MSGKPHLIPPGGTLNIWLCPSGCPTPPRFSKPSMMCWETWSISSYMSTWMTFYSSLQEHVQHISRVLQRLLENGIFDKAEKCTVRALLVPFFGYIISYEGMRMDPDKGKAVVDWPTPDSRKTLQRFLGFANFYRCFISNFSQLGAPLTALTSTRTTLRWSQCSWSCICQTQELLCFSSYSHSPWSHKSVCGGGRCVKGGVGRVLSQRSSSDDKMHPCTFSHRLSSAEHNDDIGNRELLAVKLALLE